MRFAMVVLILAATNVAADTEIHRCLLDDGSVAFQETPCPQPATNTDDDSAAGESRGDNDVPFEPTLPELVSRDRAECEKTTRDAIDAIDLAMRETAYSKAQGEAYLAELLVLTTQLRACKQL